MKFRILFDNYYFYFFLFCLVSILKYTFLNEKISFGLLFVLGLLWLSDLIFEKKMYLINFKINENCLEIIYLDKYLREKKYSKERELIKSTNYLKNKSYLNKYDILQIIEKDSFDVLNFIILEKHSQENVQTKINK